MQTDIRVPRSSYKTEWWLILAILAGGTLLRLWALGDKGLGYDEAATALMARASLGEILTFHWNAGFEHPPLWQWTMHLWSTLFGQSEFSLRLLPALMGALSIALTWAWLRALWPHQTALRLSAAGLVAISPVLVYYSQEARMYAIVLALALCSLWGAALLVHRPRARTAMAFVVANWLMTGFHYYAILLIGVEGLFFLLLALWQRKGWRPPVLWIGCTVVSLVPIALWMAFAPGFRATIGVIGGDVGGGAGLSALQFFDGLWRDLSFGGIRWQPPSAALGYLLLAPALLGMVVLIIQDWRSKAATPWSWLITLIVVAPLVISVTLFRMLAARYVLFIMPALYTLVAAAVVWLWRRHWVIGVIALAFPLAAAAIGLTYYFGPYLKSEYREMTQFLRQERSPDDAVMLYAPRQHLLAKYYLPADWTYATAPQITLPPYWPVTAPHVVPEEMDGQIQDLLAAHPALWLIVTAQDEVDPGEFVPKYLTAVSFKDDCWAWLDVQLCHFVSPQHAQLDSPVQQDILFNDEFRLEQSAAALIGDAAIGRRYMLVELDWLAEKKPSADYRVTLRLLDPAGQVVAQRDDFPIGPLLPPTTWNEGDAKPGYMALPLPGGLPAGEYRLVAGVYDPNSGAELGDAVEIGKFRWE
ncbi:MAG: glycosyltransferase family 39 protein [Anaerolineales bacterium]|nr:glycosyltransferase family 39 protein [Anaerolineales bacterium]